MSAALTEPAPPATAPDAPADERRRRPGPATRRRPTTYWPALDGLRAVAVVGVLLYHAGVRAVPGGLLGVDVFFVLSGFLITGLLLEERVRTGTVRLGAFWARRVRRLLPALLLVLLATAVAGPTLLGTDDLASLRDDALAALAYVANWRFALSGQGYFERFDDPSPLLHLWSLGVEEQFYLLWPVLVLLLAWRSRRPALVVGLLALGLTAGSTVLLAVLHADGVEASRLYYGTDTRALALLVGALLACLARPTAGRHRSRHRGGVLPVLRATFLLLVGLAGAAGLGWAYAAVDGEDPRLYDGGFLLVALAAGAVVVSVVRAPRTPLARLLALMPLVAVGRISYALYLWHWPVFLVADAERTGLTGPALLGARLGLATVLATASYVLVERPIRERGRRRSTAVEPAAGRTDTVTPHAVPPHAVPPQPRPVRSTRARLTRVRVLAPTATLLTAAAVVVATLPGVLPGVRPASAQPDLGSVASAEAAERERLLTGPAPAPGPSQEPAQPAAIEPVRVLVVGDSIGLTGGAALRRVQAQWKVTILNAGVAACGIGPGDRDPKTPDRSLPDLLPCDQWPTWWQDTVDRFDPDVVLVLTGRWETADSYVDGEKVRIGEPAFDAALGRSLDRGIEVLSSRGARVGLLTTPCVEPRERADGSTDPATSPYRTALFNTLLEQAAARHAGIARTIDLRGLLCPSGQYMPDLAGTTVRDDDGVHIDPGAGPVLAPLVLGTARGMVGLPERPVSGD